MYSVCFDNYILVMQGRTGVMICAYMLHKKLSATPDEAMATYAEKRTMDEKVRKLLLPITRFLNSSLVIIQITHFIIGSNSSIFVNNFERI